jgi:hypothetical protein
MDSKRVGEIALEACNLLQEQLDTLNGSLLADFNAGKREAYARRTKKIAELRAELQSFKSGV